jgi:selenocysteine lyase/cysteine desulfurase
VCACLQDLLHSRFRVEVPVKTIQAVLYVRISAHIYNALDDYWRLASAVLELSRQGDAPAPVET